MEVTSETGTAVGETGITARRSGEGNGTLLSGVQRTGRLVPS